MNEGRHDEEIARKRKVYLASEGFVRVFVSQTVRPQNTRVTGEGCRLYSAHNIWRHHCRSDLESSSSLSSSADRARGRTDDE